MPRLPFDILKDKASSTDANFDLLSLNCRSTQEAAKALEAEFTRLQGLVVYRTLLDHSQRLIEEFDTSNNTLEVKVAHYLESQTREIALQYHESENGTVSTSDLTFLLDVLDLPPNTLPSEAVRVADKRYEYLQTLIYARHNNISIESAIEQRQLMVRGEGPPDVESPQILWDYRRRFLLGDVSLEMYMY